MMNNLYTKYSKKMNIIARIYFDRQKISKVRDRFVGLWRCAVNSYKNYLRLTYDALFSSLSQKEKIFFIKRLSFLVSSGVTLSESLEILYGQSKSPYFRGLIKWLMEGTSNGQLLSVSLTKYKDQFGDFAINIIYFGESSGTLSENLEYLATELKKRHTLKRKIIGASIYPAVVMVGVFSVIGFLIVYLFPKILPVFSSLHMRLPLSTRIVIYLSQTLKSYGVIILVAGSSSIFIWRWLLGRFVLMRKYTIMLALYMPIVGSMTRNYNLASITRTLGLLLKAGLTLGEALTISIKTIENELYQNELTLFVEGVNRGDRLSIYLRENVLLFPDIVASVVAVGERSGNLAESFLYLSELFEEEVDDSSNNISSLIEPLLMVVMGVLVGFIAVSIISPIYGITSNLHPR
jgi:type IV pilus assembly protein PilC